MFAAGKHCPRLCRETGVFPIAQREMKRIMKQAVHHVCGHPSGFFHRISEYRHQNERQVSRLDKIFTFADQTSGQQQKPHRRN